MDRYAVFGNPVHQSKSPRIHRWFAEHCGQDLEYSAQLVGLGEFDRAAREFFEGGGRGLNVTIPFKQDAFAFADTRTERAERAGAVNTLAVQADGRILGDNTDGCGLVSDIRDNLGWPIRGKKILILGAGGAVRGVLEPLFSEQPAEILIANRTAAKAHSLAEEFADLGDITGCGYDQLAERTEPVDFLINATSLSLSGEVPPVPAALPGPDACAYDMVYGSGETPFMRWAADRGCRVADGLGMLVGQAAESFYLWRGVRPPTAGLIAALRADL